MGQSGGSGPGLQEAGEIYFLLLLLLLLSCLVGDGREEFLPSRRLDRPQRILSMQGPPVLFALRPRSTQEGRGGVWGSLFQVSGPSGKHIGF